MLYEVIKSKHIEAVKTKNVLFKIAYSNVLAKIIVAEKSGKYSIPLEDKVIEELIAKEINELKETQSYYTPGNEPYEGFSVQITELMQYLPKPLTTLEVESMIEGYVAASGETNKGKITGAIAKMVGSRFDKKLIKGIVDKVVQ